VLFTCYELIRPDVALELAWRNNYYDFCMPYIVQYLRHSHERIKALEAKTASLDKGAAEAADASAATVGDAAVQLGLYGGAMAGDGPMLLANEPYNPMGGYDHQGYGAAYAGAGYGMAAPAYGGPQQQQQQQQQQPGAQPGYGGYAPQGGYGGQW